MDSKLYGQVLSVFQSALSSTNWKVLDVGGREKDRGGSQEALRFVALVKGDDGQNIIFELKEDLGTSVASYSSQATDVLHDSLEHYIYSQVKSEHENDPSYQVIDFKIDGVKRRFLLRPKQLYFFDAANSTDTKKEENEFCQLSIYNAWFMGRIHGQQRAGPAYLKMIEEDKNNTVFSSVKTMAKDYLQVLIKALKDR